MQTAKTSTFTGVYETEYKVVDGQFFETPEEIRGILEEELIDQLPVGMSTLTIENSYSSRINEQREVPYFYTKRQALTLLGNSGNGVITYTLRSKYSGTIVKE